MFILDNNIIKQHVTTFARDATRKSSLCHWCCWWWHWKDALMLVDDGVEKEVLSYNRAAIWNKFLQFLPLLTLWIMLQDGCYSWYSSSTHFSGWRSLYAWIGSQASSSWIVFKGERTREPRCHESVIYYPSEYPFFGSGERILGVVFISRIDIAPLIQNRAFAICQRAKNGNVLTPRRAHRKG